MSAPSLRHSGTKSPLVVPVLGDLRGRPPRLIHGLAELLADDAVRLAAWLRPRWIGGQA